MDFKEELELTNLGVSAIETTKYESSFERKVSRALEVQENELECKRLEKTRQSIRELQSRIDIGAERLPVIRLSKLMDRLDELLVEEGQILDRINDQKKSNAIHEDNDTSLKFSSVEMIPPVSKKPRTSPMVSSKLTTKSQGQGQEEHQKSRVKNGDSKQESSMEEGGGGCSSSESKVERGYDEGKEVLCDDGNDEQFLTRLKRWISSQNDEQYLSLDLKVLEQPMEEQVDNIYFPKIIDTGVKGFKAPEFVWNRLFEYQKEGVKWMAGLFSQKVGGILGDEMGLGKTIQVIAFLATLQVSQLLTRPALIVCPATVMKQWVKELHFWWPMLRVILVHSTAPASGGGGRGQVEKALKVASTKGHVIITSYGHLQHRVIGKKLLKENFSIAILDEGHKIRNPTAEISISCKKLLTPNRMILSGTPIQNNLIELWSLMDFVYPGRLGTMNVFKSEIALPINVGGYVNASSLQVQTSYRCACMLKDLITPYLLRRVKADVAQSLPKKQEQVLFCQLTTFQRELYQHYVQSEEVQTILSGEKNILAGIDILRKICNHPALIKVEDETRYGFGEVKTIPKDPTEQSGKLNVLAKILEHWMVQGHRVLLFCQTRQMLNIIEKFIIERYGKEGYLRMDGTTPINQRMSLVEEFNRERGRMFLFLLTTKVGGLGVNLTGADRVIIYDPDWNPSTDVQARERAWRLGQTRPVTIYRMLTVGTIEEKIYHRQIFKQYLTNRILTDPKQTRFFKSSDLYDLFTLTTLDEQGSSSSDTATLLTGLEPGGIHFAEGDRRSSSPSKTLDQNIMTGLLEISGLHSALEHDRLVEKPLREVLLVEKEAKKRAIEAIEALKRSSKENDKKAMVTAAATTTSTPNRIGLLPGLTASTILASIKRRRQQTMMLNGDNQSCLNGSLKLPREGEEEEALERIVKQLLDLFNQRGGGGCSSVKIASTFSFLTSEDAIAFRQVLRIIASFEGRDRMWYLRPEFSALPT